MPRLVLTRKEGQTIVIGGNIRVTRDKGNRIIVEAPEEVPVNREEVQIRIGKGDAA